MQGNRKVNCTWPIRTPCTVISTFLLKGSDFNQIFFFYRFFIKMEMEFTLIEPLAISVNIQHLAPDILLH